jgi:glycosyltransferase involved in cell wall biosynthesis
MVVMPDAPDAKQHPEIVRTTIAEMESPNWWKKYELDAVVLGAWAAPRYTGIARAVQNSGALLIIRCDSGVPYSQWQKTPWKSFYDNYLSFRYRGRGWGRSGALSLLKTAAFYIPAVYEKKVIEHLACAGLILNEAPEGVRFLKALLCRYGRPDVAAKVNYVPHPVAETAGYSEGDGKERRIIAVGRWDSYQKNTPLLMKTLRRVLGDFPDYEVHIFGRGERALEKYRESVPKAIKARIHIRGEIAHAALEMEYRKSLIFFAPSRSESFNIAAAEALSCGCSFAGSGHIFSFRNFVSKNSGTVARHYTVNGMADALTTEVLSWNEGRYDPVRLSRLWRFEFSCGTVAQLILNGARVAAAEPAGGKQEEHHVH